MHKIANGFAIYARLQHGHGQDARIALHKGMGHAGKTMRAEGGYGLGAGRIGMARLHAMAQNATKEGD